MSHLVSPALEKAFGFALAKSPKATRPIDAFWRAATVVGNIEGAPDYVKNLPQTALHHPSYSTLKTSKGFLAWLALGDNHAKVEAVALALIEGRVDNKSSAAALNEIIRAADTRLGLPEFEIPDNYPVLQWTSRQVATIVDAYALAWGSGLIENARIASGDYEEYVAPPERFSDAHDAGEAAAAIRALLHGRLISYAYWDEFASSARAIFRIAEELAAYTLSYDFDDNGIVISDDVAETISNIIGDDMGAGLPADDPVVRQVRRYRDAVNERLYASRRAMIPNLVAQL